MTEADVSAAKTAAAEFIRDGLFRLGPTFVKLGQARRTIALAHAPCTPALHPPCTRPAPALCPPACVAACAAPHAACGARAHVRGRATRSQHGETLLRSLSPTAL